MATKKSTSNLIEIPAMNIETFSLRIVGDSPFICHAWSEKAKRMMLEKQTKKASAGREIRRPAVEFANCLYWLTNKPDFESMTDDEAQATLAEIIPVSKFGFPTTAFKSAAIDGGYQQGILEKKTTARGAFFVLGEFTEIEGVPTMREDVGIIGMGTPQVIFRAEFKTWATTLHIKHNANSMSKAQIVNLFNVGGFSNGIGDWRPAKDGNFGTFHIE
ncbi:MAG: hypothetical protein IJT73_00705 [Selenomonadaceae bacterium]|nr:hypothetical protein [Selenomonadaceae bacterium]